MKRTATIIATCAAVGSAGTAVAVAACPPGHDPGQGGESTTPTTTTGSASLREYDGTITSVNRSAHKFRLRTDGGKKVTIKVKGSTDFGEGASSIRSLNKGDNAEVRARKTRNGLVATNVGCPNHGQGDDDGQGGGGQLPPVAP